VGSIRGASRIQEDQHQSRALIIAADAAAGLDVFGRGFGLAQHHHQAEAADVETD
jgi:hypothetical protein